MTDRPPLAVSGHSSQSAKAVCGYGLNIDHFARGQSGLCLTLSENPLPGAGGPYTPMSSGTLPKPGGR